MNTVFITFRFLDFVDIFLVAILLFQVYKLIRGTVGMSIFIGLVSVYALWLIVRAAHMELLSTILGQFVGLGVLALVVVFQQEIRRFLLIVGTRYGFTKRGGSFRRFLNFQHNAMSKDDVAELSDAVWVLAQQRIGALIVVSPIAELEAIVLSGEQIQAKINSALLQSIFFKNTALHDGAVIIVGNTIRAAKCVLPSTSKVKLPIELGLRHRSALSMSEETTALVIVVSEQRGSVSYCLAGEIHEIETQQQLTQIITKKIKDNR